MGLALSRRGFLRTAALSSAACAVGPFAGEHALAAAARQRLQAGPNAIHIDANENPLGPSEPARVAMTGLMSQGGRYDDELSEKLLATIAAREGVPAESILLYAGSSEPLHYTVLAYTGPERPFVTADPGYEAGMRAAELNHAQVVKVPLTATHAHDVKAMLAAAPNAGVIYICNPNNPTGTTTPREAIEYAVEHKPAGAVVLVDEAYIHFSDVPSAVDLVQAGKDVIVLRTFSKIYGMAGLRCGMAIGRPELLAKLSYYGQNALSILAVASAQASLEDATLVPQRKALNARVRGTTFEWLTAQGYEFIPSESNCFMVNTRRPGHDVMKAMAAKGVMIGRVWPVMPTWVRITVGTPEEMAKFQDAFHQVMSGAVTARAVARGGRRAAMVS